MKAKQEENGFVNVSMTKLEVLELAQDLIKMALTDERVNVELIEGTGVMIPPPPVHRTVYTEDTDNYRLVFFNLVHPAPPKPKANDDGHFPWHPDYMGKVLRTRWKDTATCWSEATDEIRDMCRYAREMMGLNESVAVNFHRIHVPAEWNKIGVEFLMRRYTDMTEEQRGTFCDRFQEWLLQWEALLSQ